jgi:hypothetical protein
MAHFARLDENNIVTSVVVIDNNVPTSNGPLSENDKHIDGETYCLNLFRKHPTLKNGTWKQTSYNHSFRKCFAGIGMIYNAENDVFIRPQPYASWTLDGNFDWVAPVTSPNDTQKLFWLEVQWDEENQRFLGIDSDPSPAIWNPDTQTWSRVSTLAY